jgi:hypothetical protein
MATDPANVPQPSHPLYALTTYELADYRSRLESALARYEEAGPVPPARGDLQGRLDAVIAEQDDRARLAHA